MHMPGLNHESWQLWNGIIPMPTHFFYSGHKKKWFHEVSVLSGCVLLKHADYRWEQKQGLCRMGRGQTRGTALGPRGTQVLPSHPAILRTRRKLQGGKDRIFPLGSWAAPVANRNGWMSRQRTDASCILAILASGKGTVGQLWRSRPCSCHPCHGRA